MTQITPGLSDPWDCLIIGGGPAGLLAAAYLQRFRRSVIVVDSGHSRAKWIPVSHNCPGFAEGISGMDLLARMAKQAVRYGAVLINDTVRHVRRGNAGFLATASDPIQARSVLMATGVVDIVPDSPDGAAMLEAGSLCICPICDAYEVIDKQVAVIGPAKDALKKALFLRTYTQDVTMLVTNEDMELDGGKAD